MPFRKLLAILWLSIATTLGAGAAEVQNGQFGQYVGTLKNSFLKKEQLAKLDLVVSRNQGSELELKAVLTLHFGDFQSGEYIAYHFDKVNYNLLTGGLSFDSPDEDATIITTKFSSGILVADFRSATGGSIGELSLKLGGTAKPAEPLIEPLNGEYAAKDGSRTQVLQIHTYRATEDTARVGSPFAANAIKAQLGVRDDLLCGKPYRSRTCTTETLTGAYNFFRGELNLIGEVSNTLCKVEGNSVACSNGFVYTRTSKEQKSRIFTPPRPPAALVTKLGLPNATISGAYYGYVHNEFLDTYQPIRLDVATYQSAVPPAGLKVSATASLYFGAMGSEESITYRFDPREYPNPLIKPQFVLSRIQDDVDVFLKVTDIGHGVIRGEWYSLLFGRVGVFEASQNNGTTFVEERPILAALSETYTSPQPDIDMGLRVIQGKHPTQYRNPFFPLQIAGWIGLRGGMRQSITGGSYDFYTGKIAILFGNHRLVVGRRTPNGDIVTFMTSNGWGTVMPIHDKPRIFKLSGLPQ